MNNQEKVALLLQVVQLIFQSKLANTDITQVTITTNTGTFPGRTFVNGTIRGFDFTVQDETGIIQLRVLEQNPNKQDGFGNLKQNAILAQQGHQIAWVIRRDTNQFVSKVMDGKWEKLTPRATTNVQFNAGVSGAGTVTADTAQDQYNEAYHHYEGGDEWQADLPEIDPSDVPLYVTGV